MTGVDITTIEKLKEECQLIQSFLEAHYSSDNPAACEMRGVDIEGYMARTGKMLADAKYWRDQFVDQAMSSTMTIAARQGKLWTPTLVKVKVDAMAFEYNYLVNWCDRLNRGCTHSLDFIRTLLSKHKEEMRLVGFGK
jgi:hypothetical protein